MSEPAETIIHEGFSARARLGALGLDVDGIMEVIRRGELARAEATKYDPVTAAGTDAYRYRVRGLRETYCPFRWKARCAGGLELLVSPDENMSIVTRAGDAGVGIREAIPQPKGEIGDGTSAVLTENLVLFEPRWLQAQGVIRPERETWMLLVYFSPSVIRAELSLGSEIDDGRVSRWFERIILPELDPNDLRQKRFDDEDQGADEPFDVPVIRKK